MRLTRVLCYSGLFALGCGSPSRPGAAGDDEADVFIHRFDSDSQGAEIRDISLATGIWAANRGAPGLGRYSRSGTLDWHGVEKGEGPDALRTAWSVVASGDTGFVWDPLTKRLLRVVGNGITPEATFDFGTTHTISERAPGINFGHPGRLRPYRGGWVTYATDGPQWHAFDLTQMVLLRFDRTGKVLDTLADLRSSPLFTDQAAWKASGPKELVPVPLWDVCGGERLVFFDPAGRLLWWDRSDGRGRDSLHFAFEAGRIPEAFIRSHLYWQMEVAAQGRIPEDTLRAWLDATYGQERWMFGEVEPFAVKLFCGSDGEVWLQRFGVDAPPRGLSRNWLVVDLATKRTREARLPAGFEAMAADSSGVYGAMEDSLGIQSVGVVEIRSVLPE
jgi:hypothetical protein